MHMYYGIIIFFKKRSKKYVTYEHGRVEQFKCKKETFILYALPQSDVKNYNMSNP